MTDPISLINFFIAASSFLPMLIGLLFTAVNRVMDRKNKIFFLSMFSVLFLYITSDFINQLSQNYVLSQATLFFDSFFSSVLMPMLTWYMLFLLGLDWRKSPVFPRARPSSAISRQSPG